MVLPVERLRAELNWLSESPSPPRGPWPHFLPGEQKKILWRRGQGGRAFMARELWEDKGCVS